MNIITFQVTEASYCVFLIDYGYIQTIHTNKMKKPLHNIFNYPAMAFECCLSDVAPLDDKDDDKTSFSTESKLHFQQLIRDNGGQPLKG